MLTLFPQLLAPTFQKVSLTLSELLSCAKSWLQMRSALGEAICFYYVNTAEDPKLQVCKCIKFNLQSFLLELVLGLYFTNELL